MKGYISYEKALEILDKIDDSYFSEKVVDNDKLLNEVWEMLALANRLFQSHLDICGTEGDPGAIGADRADGEFDRALDENPGVKGGFVLGRFLPLEWMQQNAENAAEITPPNEALTWEELKSETNINPVYSMKYGWIFPSTIKDEPYAQIWFFTSKGFAQTELFYHDTFYRRPPEGKEGTKDVHMG